jgi:hypothetical protein
MPAAAGGVDVPDAGGQDGVGQAGVDQHRELEADLGQAVEEARRVAADAPPRARALQRAGVEQDSWTAPGRAYRFASSAW